MELGQLNASSIKSGEGSSSGALMLDVPVLPSETSATLMGLTSQRAGQLACGVTKGSYDLYYSLADDGKFHALSDVQYLRLLPDLSTPLTVSNNTFTTVEVASNEWTGHLARYDDVSNYPVFPSNFGSNVWVYGSMTWQGSSAGFRAILMGSSGIGSRSTYHSVKPPDANSFTCSFMSRIPEGLYGLETNNLTVQVYQNSGSALDLEGLELVLIGGISGIPAFPPAADNLTPTAFGEYWPDLS